MGDVGLLLSLPSDSIAVRVALASVAAMVLGRLLLRAGLRSPRVRAVVALLPALSIGAICVAFASNPALPALWHTVDASGALSIPVRDTYLSFAPSPVPLLLGGWAAVTMIRLVLRTRNVHRGRSVLRAAVAAGTPANDRTVVVVERLAVAMRTMAPRVVIAPQLPGGAAILGIHRPVLVLDGSLLQRLDKAELEGVIAHELAHVQRRDNLVAAALGVLRDVFFFVPGGSWSLRGLLREREYAADVTAVDVTGRPGALASGLLKVLEGAAGRSAIACAPLLSEGTLVARVEQLCDERPAPTRPRRAAETTLAVGALAGAVVAAVLVPQAVVGAQGERDALGVMLSDVAVQGDGQDAPRSAVFSAYDGASGTLAQDRTVPATVDEPIVLDDPAALTPTGLAACAGGFTSCATVATDARLPLAPQPIVRIDEGLVDRWRLDPLVRSDNQQVGVFWFQRLTTQP